MPPLCTVGSFLWHLLFGFKDPKRVYWGPTFRDSSPSGSLPTVQSPSPIGVCAGLLPGELGQYA